MGHCLPCFPISSVLEKAQKSKYRIELYLDEQDRANLIFHTVGEDFIATEEALNKFIEKIQEQITNKKTCPFFKESE